MTVYKCKKCGHEAAKKQSLLKHAYSHLRQAEWPYKCPIHSCEWFGKFPGEYKGHQNSKQHLKSRLRHPDMDDDSPDINPEMRLVKETEWVAEDASRLVPIPLPPTCRSATKPEKKAKKSIPLKLKGISDGLLKEARKRTSSDNSKSSSPKVPRLPVSSTITTVTDVSTLSEAPTFPFLVRPEEVVSVLSVSGSPDINIELPPPLFPLTPIIKALSATHSASPVASIAPMPVKKGDATPLLDECPFPVHFPPEQSVIETEVANLFPGVHFPSPKVRVIPSASSSVSSSAPSLMTSSTVTSLPSTIAGEMRKTRADLSHHFLRFENTAESRSSAQLQSLGASLDHIKKMEEVLSSIDTLVKSQVNLMYQARPSLRLRLSDCIDSLLNLLASMHNHPDQSSRFSPACLVCQRAETLIFQAVELTDPRLSALGHRL